MEPLTLFIYIFGSFVLRDFISWLVDKVTHKAVYNLGWSDAVYTQKHDNPYRVGYRAEQYIKGYAAGVDTRNKYRNKKRSYHA